MGLQLTNSIEYTEGHCLWQVPLFMYMYIGNSIRAQYIACGLRALRMSLVSGSLRGIEGGIDINV